MGIKQLSQMLSSNLFRSILSLAVIHSSNLRIKIIFLAPFIILKLDLVIQNSLVGLFESKVVF